MASSSPFCDECSRYSASTTKTEQTGIKNIPKWREKSSMSAATGKQAITRGKPQSRSFILMIFLSTHQSLSSFSTFLTYSFCDNQPSVRGHCYRGMDRVCVWYKLTWNLQQPGERTGKGGEEKDTRKTETYVLCLLSGAHWGEKLVHHGATKNHIHT